MRRPIWDHKRDYVVCGIINSKLTTVVANFSNGLRRFSVIHFSELFNSNIYNNLIHNGPVFLICGIRYILYYVLCISL